MINGKKILKEIITSGNIGKGQEERKKEDKLKKIERGHYNKWNVWKSCIENTWFFVIKIVKYL